MLLKNNHHWSALSGLTLQEAIMLSGLKTEGEKSQIASSNGITVL